MLRFRELQIWLIVTLTWSLVVPGLAHAQDLPCNEPFGTNDFVAKMNEADAALAEFELEKYRALLADVQDLLPCTYDRVHPNFITR